MAYTILLFDSSCHLYRSLDSGQTFTETNSPAGSEGDFWTDMAMAINDGDYTTIMPCDTDISSGNRFSSAIIVATYDTYITGTFINPSVSNIVEGVSAAISTNVATILCPMWLAETGSGYVLQYPRISTDRGVTWSDVTGVPTGTAFINACFSANATTMYMAPASGHIYKSSNSGATWSQLSGGPTFQGNINSAGGGNNGPSSRIMCSTNGSVIASVSNSGTPTTTIDFYLSSDGGATWVHKELIALAGSPTFSDTPTADLSMSPDGTLIAVSISGNFGGTVGGYVWKTSDGVSFTQLNPPAAIYAGDWGFSPSVISLSPDKQCIAVGYFGALSGEQCPCDVSTDAGSTWTTKVFTLSSLAGGETGTFVRMYAFTTPAPGYINIVAGLPYCASYLSTKLAYAAQRGTALNLVKKVDHIGFVLQNTHFQGLKYGPYNLNPVRWPTAFSPDFSPDFDTSSNLFRDQRPPLDNLPLVEKGAPIPENLIWEFYDNVRMEWAGNSESDPRIFLQACSPRPCTVVAVSLHIETDE